VGYFKQRMTIHGGNLEELWFAILKLGEIYERFYHNWAEAETYYKNCTDRDPHRADAWFYIGQHYRLAGQYKEALPYLTKAATLPVPDRALFQWHYLYYCLSKLEYGRNIAAMTDATPEIYQEAKTILATANCTEGDPGNAAELKSFKELLTKKKR